MTTLLIVAVLVTIAVARVVRFITRDKLSEPARSWLINRRGTDSMAVYGVHCPHCVAVWIAAPATAAVWFVLDPSSVLGVPWWLGWPAAWLTIAYTAGVIVAREAA